jgi:hypothetical protein
LLESDGQVTGAAVGFLALIGFAPILAGLMRGRSDSFDRLGIALLLLLFAFPLLGGAAAVGLNAALDDARPARHATVVVSTWSGKGGGYVTVRSWRRGHDNPKLSVSAAFVGRVRTGDPVVVTTGPGCFGWEWFVGIRSGS